MKWTPLCIAGVAFAAAALITLVAACGDGTDSTSGGSATPTTATTGAGPIRLENPTVTASGLKYTDNRVGTGASPRPDQSVTVHYRGTLAVTGAAFDSSYDRGQPVTFAMTGVIKGFAEGLSTMKVGGKRTMIIPAAQAYGASSRAGIPANSDLVFEVELLAIQDPPKTPTPTPTKK